jgi:hypothetical protein
MTLRDHTFLGLTQSLCPECRAVVPAKIIERDNRIYFRKRCPEHGERDDFICSDASYFDRLEFSVPGRIPAVIGAEVDKGCPLDCGLCPDHEQHTCLGLVEVTSSCNLRCPMCYAGSGPGGAHLSLEECKKSIDRLVEVEGGAEVLQLSGGEPTVHPEFAEILAYACAQRIELVMINSNGLRFAADPALVEVVAKYRHRVEVYLQFDGFSEETSVELRGAASLVEQKIRAIELLGAAGVRVILVCTLQAGLNLDQVGEIIRFGAARPWVTGVSFQPATYSGRHVLPEELERRITFPDVIKAIAAQTDGLFHESDLIPLPCAHPNCHSLTYAYRHDGTLTPLTRFIRPEEHVDLLANGISFTRPRARELVQTVLDKTGCLDGPCDSVGAYVSSLARARAAGRVGALEGEFFARALAEELAPSDVFRLTITSFLDVYNFDVRRVMKCCIHHVLPSGHVVPFCAYNVLYRDGHVPLPPLTDRPDAAAARPVPAAPFVALRRAR